MAQQALNPPFPENTVSRLAPTPSGFLHAGNALSFILTWLLVRHHKGTLHLRIDDLDRTRKRPEYIEDIFSTLQWLGITPDHGPSGPADFEQHFSQEHRLPAYFKLLEQLKAAGQLFACDCSRATIQRHSTDGQYSGRCHNRNLPFNTPGVAWRYRTPHSLTVTIPDWLAGNLPVPLHATMRDPVLRRKDSIPAYQIASLADDEAMGTTLIVRGMDLLQSTAMQQHLAKQLSLPGFARATFWHHPLLQAQDSAGQKLSKSAGSLSLQYMRSQGLKPAAFYQWVSSLLGLQASNAKSLLHTFTQQAISQLPQNLTYRPPA